MLSYPRPLKVLVKFIYSEKATKFLPYLHCTVDLTVTTYDKSTVEISQNFGAFSEYMNIKKNSNTCKFHIWMVYFPHGHVFSCDLFENTHINCTFERFLLLMNWCHMCSHRSFYGIAILTNCTYFWMISFAHDLMPHLSS